MNLRNHQQHWFSPDSARAEPQSLSFLEGKEEQTARLAARIQTAVDTHPVHLLQTATLDLHGLEARGDVPHVAEGDAGELASPLHGQADAAAERVDGVAQVLPAVEAAVGVGPHAVHGVGGLGFGQDILEGHLKEIEGNVRQVSQLISKLIR